jgi:peroxiredoxin
MKKNGAAEDPNASSARLRQLLPAVLTALAIGFVAVRFAAGARETLSRTRDGACTALAPDPLPAALRDRPPPDFKLPDASGQMVSLSGQRGHPVMLNFWATWCPPCVEEMPALEDLARRLDGTDMRLLAVSVDDDWAQIRRFFPKGSKIGVVLDKSHDIPKAFGTEKYPETFMIDSAGRVRYYFVNKRDWDSTISETCLRSVVEEAS